MDVIIDVITIHLTRIDQYLFKGVMFRQQSLLTTGKLAKLQHVFSSKKHLIFRSYQQETLETYLTKRIIVKDEKVMHYYKHHIYHHILPYLLSQHNDKQASILQIHPSYAEVMVQAKFIPNIGGSLDDSDFECDDELVEADGNTIFISKSIIYGTSLREMILNKDQRLDKQFCLDLVGAILGFILGNNGVEDLMITAENIIVQDSGFFHLNYFSFVGLEFSKFDKYITKAEFEQILPFLTSRFIKEEEPQKRSIDVWMQLKFIMLNFYGALFKKDFVFDSKYLDLDVEVRRTDQRVIATVEKVESSLLPKLMTAQFKQQIGDFDKLYKVNYSQLMQQVIKNTKDSKCSISWEYIISDLSKNSEEMRSDINNQRQHFERYLIERNEVPFAAHVFEVFDLYITLVLLIEQEQGSQKKIKNHKILNIFKSAKQLQQQREKLLSRHRYSQSLYMPIKFGMNFTTLLKYRNWIDMLNSALQTDSSTLEALHKLINFIVQIRQNLVELEPVITNQIIRQLLKKQPTYSSFENDIRSLTSYLQKIQDDFKPISDEVDSPTLTHQQKNLKAQFWDITFWCLNQLLLLAKNFFLRVTATTVKGNIIINRHEFSTIVQYIEEYTPPLTFYDDS